jgi:hypothetical protein
MVAISIWTFKVSSPELPLPSKLLLLLLLLVVVEQPKVALSKASSLELPLLSKQLLLLVVVLLLLLLLLCFSTIATELTFLCAALLITRSTACFRWYCLHERSCSGQMMTPWPVSTSCSRMPS